MVEKIIIAAVSENGVIGKGNELPWHLPEDLKRFKEMTTGYAVLMGRKTYDSIPEKFRPLKQRCNIVLSSNYESKGILVVNSIDEGVNHAEWLDEQRVYFAGGESVYNEGIKLADTIELTRVHDSIEGDRYFPDIDSGIWEKVWERKGKEYSFQRFMRRVE